MAGNSGAQSLLNGFFAFRLVPWDRPRHQGPTCVKLPDGNDCELAIVEFDDQGLCFARSAMDDLEQALGRLETRNPIIIVFAHGWKHDASGADSNLASFSLLLREAATHGGGRPVLGVYVAWRGLSRDGNWLWVQSSFWDRRQAAQRVALGSARELLGRLKAFRDPPPAAAHQPSATLVVIGHSFGGLLVYAAVAQSLIEAAATQSRVVPSFGDLVLLVNPAFSAVSYLPIHEIVRDAAFDPDLLPVCVSVTATNDWATKYAYPLGAWPSLLTEACRGAEEREALIHTMGHLPWMRTHELTATASAAAAAAQPTPGPQASTLRSLSTSRTEAHFGMVTVQRRPAMTSSPFWVASATPDVVDGHNGIFKPAFIDFVRELVVAHITKAK